MIFVLTFLLTNVNLLIQAMDGDSYFSEQQLKFDPKGLRDTSPNMVQVIIMFYYFIRCVCGPGNNYVILLYRVSVHECEFMCLRCYDMPPYLCVQVCVCVFMCFYAYVCM